MIKALKIIGKIILGLLIAIAAILLSLVGGYLIRWFIWLICFIAELSWGKTAITNWIGSHDLAMLIISSFLTLPVLLLAGISHGSSSTSGNHSQSKSSDDSAQKYENDLNDIRKRNFVFVDASGAYRHWGDDFVDCKGNWCSWGSGFYDYDENYIRWGNTFKDSSGSYRKWGEDFVDCAGNWVKNIPQ